jgi:large subunit ribosomal protein L32
MPLPKRRHSNQRTRLRRTHYKLNVPAIAECPSCHAPIQPHHACPTCGKYGVGSKSRTVLTIKENKKGGE